MALLDIYQDSVGRGTCRSCGAAIVWAQLTSGKRIPLEGTELVVLRTQGDLLGGGRIVQTIDTSITPTHFERCPDAQDWRRR